MKLVEILARELKEWPHQCHAILQDADRMARHYVQYCEDGCDWFLLKSLHDLAEDHATAEITRAQWEAERARMAMDCISAISQEQDQAEKAVSQYEKELWDKVAIQAIGRLGNITSLSEAADAVASLADAFMAERAKRLKEVK